MKSEEIRSRFLEFFKKRGHAVLPSASLVPVNDPSALFTTAGMQPLVPYLLGEKHPLGSRLVNIQKCVRTQDIDEVGDKTHDTFFEMLGNWSLGDYFKKEAIGWSYELMTDKNEGFGLDPKRLYITVFAGDPSTSLGASVPRDLESFEVWRSLGIPESRIYFLGADKNWWSPGDNGPCGPDTEMYYDVTEGGLGDLTPEQFKKADDEQKIVEIWNDVFMEYEKKGGKIIGKLAAKNVDTGAGLERFAMVLQGVGSIFETDLFLPLMQKIRGLSKVHNDRSERIVADHIRTAVFMISDGVLPENTDRGYILRRIIRRAVRHARVLGFGSDAFAVLASEVEKKYRDTYKLDGALATVVIDAEARKFDLTLEHGMKEFNKLARAGKISGHDAFLLFSSYGFPLELTREMAKEKNVPFDEAGFAEEFRKHQELSRVGAEQKFKGGLAEHSEMTVKYHTATHMLNAALKQVLGEHVGQKGSNITAERLRFDFSHPEKMTDEQKKKVEDIVNEKIKEDLPVVCEEMPLEEAKARGATGVFGEKYADRVKVYRIGGTENTFSYEICGGPHVERTGVLGHFKILKEEAVAAGIRRIKAVLE
jgi:alanyl-tRNA synthetase